LQPTLSQGVYRYGNFLRYVKQTLKYWGLFKTNFYEVWDNI